MSDIAIRVEGLSKQYRLGEKEPYKSIRDVIMHAAKKPLSWLKNDGSSQHDNKDQYFWALDDVSFDVKRGEALGIIGPNGAGKSTLLKILSGITKPTKGYADIYGRVGSLLEVGTGFHPELTGRENIYLNGAVLGMRRYEINRKFDEIVEFSGVETYLDTPVKRYSSGMYVRLAFAVAAHLEPEILLVDEVLAVGDAEFQKKCLGKMDDVAGEGRTVLFVSHNLPAIMNLCKNCILLNKGKVISNTLTEKTIDRYRKIIVEKEKQGSDLNFFRPNWARPFIQDVQLKNDKGEISNSFSSGETITVEMVFNSLEDHRINQPVMGLAILNSESLVVGKVNTRMTGFKINDYQPEKSAFVAHLENFPLTSGNYSFNLYLGDGISDIDALFDILNFTIIPTDYFGTGKIPTYKPGVIYFKPTWEIKNE
jgi:lipopolysaccharide transport system ATP-binding protein